MVHGKPLSTLHVLPGIRDRSRGWLAAGGILYPCALGKGGPVHRKREGDGATPITSMAVLGGLWRADRGILPASRVRLTPIRPWDGWCDDPSDGRYNRKIALPAACGHEVLTRADCLYDIVVLLDWNISSRVRGRGSAIFLHLAHEDFRPTEGCIAVSRQTMLRLLPRIGRGTVLRVRGAGTNRRLR